MSRGDFIPMAWKALRRFFETHCNDPDVSLAREREGYFLPRVFTGTTILLSSLPAPPTIRSVVTTGSLFLLEPKLPICPLDASFAWFPEVSRVGEVVMWIYFDQHCSPQDDIPPDVPRAFTLLALNHPGIFDGEDEWTPQILYRLLRSLQWDETALRALIR